MILPTTKIEKKLSKEGAEIVIGVDEAGRGPLAGPVVAAAAWVNPDILDKKFEDRDLIRDSKTLSEKQRSIAFANIESSDDFIYGIGEVSHEMIDQMNILNATLLAMRLAVENLIVNCQLSVVNGASDKKICLMIDGNKKIPKIKAEQRLFPRGDQRVFSIAAASICAKFYRDNIMYQYHAQFPEYGFDRHKGYGTRHHLEQIKKHSPCPIHRKTFGPVRNCRL